MDCNLARCLLPFSRRGIVDLDAADVAALDRHLRSCPACAAASTASKSFDTALARAMRDVTVPAGMRGRIGTTLKAARLSRYRWLAARGLVAACLLGAAAWSVAEWRRPAFDAALLAQQTYQLGGQARTDEEARTAVTDWLKLVDDRLQAPPEFNYKLLAFADRTAIQGLSQVPTLVFSRGDATLRVFAVKERAFRDLGEVREEVGGCTVETRRYDTLPGWVFILVTSGASPDAFRQPARPLDPA
jgi:hypothetical protein